MPRAAAEWPLPACAAIVSAGATLLAAAPFATSTTLTLHNASQKNPFFACLSPEVSQLALSAACPYRRSDDRGSRHAAGHRAFPMPILSRLIWIRLFVPLQPEAEPVNIALLRGHALEWLLQNVLTLWDVNEVNGFFPVPAAHRRARLPESRTPRRSTRSAPASGPCAG